MKVIKYVGRFSGSEAQGIVFPKNVPVIVESDALAKTLLEQPDFAASSIEELGKVQTELDAAVNAPKAAPSAPVKAQPIAAGNKE